MNPQAQMTEAIQKYFSLNNINEKADLGLNEYTPGRVFIELRTRNLLNEKDLICVNQIVELCMPLGLMWEFKNTCEGNSRLITNE